MFRQFNLTMWGNGEIWAATGNYSPLKMYAFILFFLKQQNPFLSNNKEDQD